MSNTIRVAIDHAKFWRLAGEQPIHMNVSVFNELRKNGIPVDGGIEMRGVLNGRLVMFNERRDGKRFCVYEWTPGPDSRPFDDDEDDEL